MPIATDAGLEQRLAEIEQRITALEQVASLRDLAEIRQLLTDQPMALARAIRDELHKQGIK